MNTQTTNVSVSRDLLLWLSALQALLAVIHSHTYTHTGVFVVCEKVVLIHTRSLDASGLRTLQRIWLYDDHF